MHPVIGAWGAGALMGFLGSIPLAGPIAILVFSRGVAGRFRNAFQIALGSGFAEGLYAFVAAWGMGSLFEAHPRVKPALEWVSALLLIGIGVALALLKQKRREAAVTDEGRAGLALGFSVTALNPTFLATWSAAIALAHTGGVTISGLHDAAPFALGAWVGIVAWFAALLQGIRYFQSKRRPLSPRWMGLIQRGVGGVLIAMGLWAGVAQVLR